MWKDTFFNLRSLALDPITPTLARGSFLTQLGSGEISVQQNNVQYIKHFILSFMSTG